MRRWQLYLPVVLVALLTACSPKGPRLTPQALPTLAVPATDERFPIAQPLTEYQIEDLDDEPARRMVGQDREQVRGRQKRSGDTGFFFPRLIPRSPARLAPDRADEIALPADEVLEGYLDMAASSGEGEHNFLVMLLVDYRQAPFELGGNLASAHLVRLPTWELRTFSFRLPESLGRGRHELLVMVHDDPYNIYATRGVVEKHRQGGKLTFDAAAGRPFPRPLAIRYNVIVGEEGKVPWVQMNWAPDAFKPHQTDLLNTPLYLSLTGDETDPLIGCEPAMVAGSDDPLYAFVYYDFATPEGSLSKTTAALVAILDDQQVRINRREALFFRVQSGRRYRFPLHIEWPNEVSDGGVHALYVGIAFGIGHDWQEKQGVWQSLGFQVPWFANPVMVVPERQLIEYIWNECRQ